MENKAKIFEIEKLFQSGELLKILEYCNQFFIKIDDIEKQFRIRKNLNPQLIKDYMLKLNGYYGILMPILAIADSELVSREARIYNNLKLKLERFTMQENSSIKKQAIEEVAEYRKIRNILNSYVNVCDKTIINGQSILKYFGDNGKSGIE